MAGIGRRCVLGGLAALAAPDIVQAREVWRMAGMDEFPPYNHVENGRFAGLDITILTEAARRLGVVMDFVPLPWRRVLLALDTGEADGLFQLAPTPVRFRNWLMVPLRPTRLVFVARRDLPLRDVASLNDLTGLSVGVVDGFTYTPAFNTAAEFLHEESVDDQTSLRKLLLERADLIVGGEANLRFVMGRLGVAGTLRVLPTPLDVQNRHVGFARSAAGQDKALRLNAELERMRAEGRIDAILGRTAP